MQLPPKVVRARVLETVLFAQEELGVEYVGLGSYTPSVTRQGMWLEAQSSIKTYLTHGDQLTTWIALEGIREKIGLNLQDTKVAIVGASGLIGQVLSRMLVKNVHELILIGRNWNKLSILKEKILSENESLLESKLVTATDVSSIKEADLVISVTSSPDAIIKENYLKEGVIVYDLAQPMDVSPDICINRADILKVDGGYVLLPGVELGIDLGPPKGSVFSCLGDVTLQCLEDTKQNFVGPVDPKHVERIGAIARKYGFRHASPTCFSWPIPEAYLSLTGVESYSISERLMSAKI